MRNRSIVIYLVGVAIMVYSVVRWSGLIYKDYSSMLIFIFMGGLIAATGYMWEWMEERIAHEKNRDKRIDSIAQELKNMKDFRK